ncbi:MAG TPA: hypothetical protein GX745_04815 [Clostridiales bacterium]|jgi:hypothetical protein|nr:hypothetical protein [Clostridiales bacterium]
MIKYKTMSDNIYNSIAVFFAVLAFFFLAFYQIFLFFNKGLMGVNMLYNFFIVFEIIFLFFGAFFSFKQLVRNRHIETVTAAIALCASLLNFVAFNFAINYLI